MELYWIFGEWKHQGRISCYCVDSEKYRDLSNTEKQTIGFSERVSFLISFNEWVNIIQSTFHYVFFCFFHWHWYLSAKFYRIKVGIWAMSVLGNVVAQWLLSASDLRPEGREFEPWPLHPRCVLRQNTYVAQCLSPPRCINGNQGQPDKMLGGNAALD